MNGEKVYQSEGEKGPVKKRTNIKRGEYLLNSKGRVRTWPGEELTQGGEGVRYFPTLDLR